LIIKNLKTKNATTSMLKNKSIKEDNNGLFAIELANKIKKISIKISIINIIKIKI
jgi:hypothetical protein